MSTAAQPKHDDDSGEYNRPDAEKAFTIYDGEIKDNLTKMAELRGECAQPWKDIRKIAHFPRPVINFILALESLDDDQKQEHYVLALNEGMKLRGIGLPDDLVTRANGEEGGSAVPVVKRTRPRLIAVEGTGEPEPDADGDDFTEATDDELAAQTDRPGNEAEETDD